MNRFAGYKGLGSYGTIGLEIVLSILLGLWIGTYLDDRFGTSPWMAVVWFFFGCGAAVKAVHRGWKDMQAAAKREEAEEGNPAPAFPDDTSLRWKREEEAHARSEEEARTRGEAEGEGEGPPAEVADDEQGATKEPERRDDREEG